MLNSVLETSIRSSVFNCLRNLINTGRPVVIFLWKEYAYTFLQHLPYDIICKHILPRLFTEGNCLISSFLLLWIFVFRELSNWYTTWFWSLVEILDYCILYIYFGLVNLQACWSGMRALNVCDSEHAAIFWALKL